MLCEAYVLYSCTCKGISEKGKNIISKRWGDMISDVDIDLWLSGVLAENIAELYIAY